MPKFLFTIFILSIMNAAYADERKSVLLVCNAVEAVGFDSSSSGNYKISSNWSKFFVKFYYPTVNENNTLAQDSYVESKNFTWDTLPNDQSDLMLLERNSDDSGKIDKYFPWKKHLKLDDSIAGSYFMTCEAFRLMQINQQNTEFNFQYVYYLDPELNHIIRGKCMVDGG